MPNVIRRYYDANTRLFLRFGASAETATIHRALWLPGITRLSDALSAAHDLILDQARGLGDSPNLLDLGCGVGAALFALLARLPASGIGLTISPVQARLAARHAPPTARILEADFHALPLRLVLIWPTPSRPLCTPTTPGSSSAKRPVCCAPAAN
jgi:cyclopropane fatty-acyl-phospholipid synthase-like methyltransferase